MVFRRGEGGTWERQGNVAPGKSEAEPKCLHREVVKSEYQKDCHDDQGGQGEYEFLKDLSPYEQVAGQVFYTNCAIEKGLSQIDASRCLKVSYEEFCMNPGNIFSQIVSKLADQGYKTDWSYTGPDHFQSTNQIRLPEEDCTKIKAAYKKFSEVDLSI